MAIELKSFNQILGDMIRKIISETPLNDVNAGSVLLSLLEACASNDFENNVAILNVLELLNIDAIKNNDLDARAGDYGLKRASAVKASGLVTLLNSNITKRSTGLYVIKPAPISGQQTLYVNDTTGWSPSGTLYIGRGTDSFEGPIAYSAITVYPTYSQITLSSALQKDHLISDGVIAAGTVVKIPANNQNPEILYLTLRDAVIPSGEDRVTNVSIIARVPGSQGNAQINTVTQFDTLPFSGATVTNDNSFSSGKDVETDTELRNRVKSYSITLARGTAPSITAAVIGISDADDSKQVASAVITEPIKVGDPSILYIDDGSGFQPSYTGQSVDKMLSNANGSEEFLQLANFPVPRPQVVNVVEGPFTLSDSMILTVAVDGVEESITFKSSSFLNISAATVAEIIIAINDNSTLFKARFTNNSANILLYPVEHDVETIQVVALRSTDISSLYINSVLKFPTNESSYISLYQNSTKLREKTKTATVETVPFASWNIISDGNLIISVDGTPSQDRGFTLSDFPGAASYAGLSLEEWVTAFNVKYAGITAVATPGQTMKISSNKTGGSSSLVVNGGTYLNKMLPNKTLSAVGQTSQFQLNRQTGNIRILNDILAGDNISAGVEDAKGFAISSSTTSGTYNVSSDGFGRPSEMVIVADSSVCVTRAVPLLVGATITVSDQGSSVMRLLSSTLSAFASLQPGDFIYITKRKTPWFNPQNTGLYKIIAKGPHLTANTDSYIEVLNDSISPQAAITVVDSQDIKAFNTDGYPQIWRGTYVGNPPAEPISGVVDSINNGLIGVKASVFRSNSIKLTSITENNGSIAIPVCVGNATSLFTQTTTAQEGNPSHIANRVSDKSLFGLFKRTAPVSNNVWLGRYTYTNAKGSLTANAVPDTSPFAATYSETVASTGSLSPSNVDYADILAFTRGNNKGQFRSIKAKIAVDSVGTQQDTARTEFDHITNDEFMLMRSMQFATDDSIVFILDKDTSTKTVDTKIARTGQVNSGSNLASFLPTTTELSANDIDNEPGIDFGNANVWSTSINKTNFNDYALLMRARNWYSTGGVAGSAGKMMLRSSQYGSTGEKMRFNIRYPNTPNQTNTTVLQNTPSWNLLSYFFGSGADRSTVLANGDTMAVNGPYPDSSTNFPAGAASTGNYFDYTFSAGTFTSVVVGDVLSILDNAGISTFNRGQFSVANKSGNTVRVFNPSASTTFPGSSEIITVNTIADLVGTQTNTTITVTSAAALDGTYFTMYDNSGSIKVWFDVDNDGTAEPVSVAHNRTIKIETLITGDLAATVASKIAAYLSNDVAFANVFSTPTQVIYDLAQNGPVASPVDGTVPTGFTFINAPGIADASLDGKYMILYDDVGSVAVWFDVGDNGTQEPFHGADRSIRVYAINYGDTAATVAAAIAAAVNPDLKFNAISNPTQVIITTAFSANTTNAVVGTSGFTAVVADGSLSAAEIITNPGQIHVFPLVNTSVSDIVSKINEKDILKVAAIGTASLTITKSTQEDDYTYGGDSTALGYGHNPGSTSLRDHVSLYDGINWVKTFANANPNFTLKTALTLNGVAPSVYAMNTAPNEDASLGEFFKLVPTTVKNVQHHLTQKAMSQLPIISDVNISSSGKNVQVKSKQLGSSGALEVVGGRANSAQAYIIGESEVASDTSGNYLLAKIPAFPDAFSVGDMVKLENDAGVNRLSRLLSTDSISVTSAVGTTDYNFNPKTTNINAATTFTITDVSSSYARPAGTVWRWTHGGGVTLASVRAGDLVTAFGTLTGWAQGNKARIAGDSNVAGLPVVGVNDSLNWFDVVNPYGKAMSSTAVGGSSTVQICPTPIIKWNLDHAARVHITGIVRLTNVVTVDCETPHLLNTGDSVNIIDSNNLADGTYSSITVTSASQFTFASVGTDFTEVDVKASALNAGTTRTRYRIERLGFNGLTKLSRQDGESPRFTDCGVAVDDYMVIGGNTFKSNNNGRFRVLAVDNDSVIYSNTEASSEIDTVTPFNNKGLLATWTTNNNIVSGIAGTFKGLALGDWIKKEEDAETAYVQVTSFNPPTADTATQLTVGSNYIGTSSDALSVAYKQDINHDKGVYLSNVEDIAFFEGDSLVNSDTLFVQNIINASWFSVNNTGSFEIAENGTNTVTYKPFIRVNNSTGVAEANRLMSVDTSGLYIIESEASKFYTYRQIDNACIDSLNNERRSIYLTPASRNYKFSEANNTSITHLGKLGYSTDVTVGVDGYLYYTGLLRRVQRTVDGFEPDPDNFPGRRAVGGFIETLPPLIKDIVLTVDITTDEGVNLGDISNNIKSTIINYVQGLGVGADVILSEIIASIMQIKGVGAVTFTNPVPSTERITVANNEKATISSENIGIA